MFNKLKHVDLSKYFSFSNAETEIYKTVDWHFFDTD